MSGETTRGAARQSNFELFRIITMLLVIAHHYVVNSGIAAMDGPIFADPTAPRSLYLLLWGAWGKTGLNCFVLLSERCGDHKAMGCRFRRGNYNSDITLSGGDNRFSPCR